MDYDIEKFATTCAAIEQAVVFVNSMHDTNYSAFAKTPAGNLCLSPAFKEFLISDSSICYSSGNNMLLLASLQKIMPDTFNDADQMGTPSHYLNKLDKALPKLETRAQFALQHELEKASCKPERDMLRLFINKRNSQQHRIAAIGYLSAAAIVISATIPAAWYLVRPSLDLANLARGQITAPESHDRVNRQNLYTQLIGSILVAGGVLGAGKAALKVNERRLQWKLNKALTNNTHQQNKQQAYDNAFRTTEAQFAEMGNATYAKQMLRGIYEAHKQNDHRSQ